MPLATAVITFEATNPADAEAIMATWTLSAGCTVAASMTVPVGAGAAETDASGGIVPPPENPA